MAPFPLHFPPDGSRILLIADYTPQQVAVILNWAVQQHVDDGGIECKAFENSALRRWHQALLERSTCTDNGNQPVREPSKGERRAIRAGMFDLREALKLAWSVAERRDSSINERPLLD